MKVAHLLHQMATPSILCDVKKWIRTKQMDANVFFTKKKPNGQWDEPKELPATYQYRKFADPTNYGRR